MHSAPSSFVCLFMMCSCWLLCCHQDWLQKVSRLLINMRQTKNCWSLCSATLTFCATSCDTSLIPRRYLMHARAHSLLACFCTRVQSCKHMTTKKVCKRQWIYFTKSNIHCIHHGMSPFEFQSRAKNEKYINPYLILHRLLRMCWAWYPADNTYLGWLVGWNVASAASYPNTSKKSTTKDFSRFVWHCTLHHHRHLSWVMARSTYMYVRTFASPPILLINLFEVQTRSQMKFGSLPSSDLRHCSFISSTYQSIYRHISIRITDVPWNRSSATLIDIQRRQGFDGDNWHGQTQTPPWAYHHNQLFY